MENLTRPKLSRRKIVQRSMMARAATSLLPGTGKVHAQQVSFRSVMPVGGNGIEYSFAGSVAGNSMSGTVELGEYGHAQWSATRETS